MLLYMLQYEMYTLHIDADIQTRQWERQYLLDIYAILNIIIFGFFSEMYVCYTYPQDEIRKYI